MQSARFFEPPRERESRTACYADEEFERTGSPLCFLLIFAISREYDEVVIQGKLAYVCYCRPATRAHTAVVVYQIGQTFASDQLRRIGDFEVQVRLAGITGTADAREHLASPYSLSCLNTQTSRL